MSEFTMPDHLIDKLTDNLRIANKRIAALESALLDLLELTPETLENGCRCTIVEPDWEADYQTARNRIRAVIENKED